MQAALASFSPAAALPRAPREAWQVLDDPAEWPAFGHALDGGDAGTGRWESQVAVEGMHCAGCGLAVEAALLRVAGVLEVQVNAASQHDPLNRWSTYTHPGLPPTPIANPGEKSIAAVLSPAATRYFYFVAKGGGRHTFSESRAAHDAAVHPH